MTRSGPEDRRLPRAALILAILLLATAASGADGGRPDGLVGHWLFDAGHVEKRIVRDLAGELDATLRGSAALRRNPPALLLDGSTAKAVLSEGPPPAVLPRAALTAEVWVAVDRAVDWGGFVGFVQDNGGFEKGWILGTRGSRFSFALSTAGADDGDGVLTYLTARSESVEGAWYHVTGTYDGTEQRIYVNGRCEASARIQSGAIRYPESGFFEIAAYHDSNEQHLFPGGLHEVRLYDRALTAGEVAARFEAKRGTFPLALDFLSDPAISRDGSGRTTLSWETVEPGSAIIEYGRSRPPRKRIAVAERSRAQEVTLPRLKAESTYFCRIRWSGAGGEERLGPILSFDTPPASAVTELRPVISPYAEDELTPVYERAAERIVKEAGTDKGYCLVLDCGTGRLAFEIAKRTSFRVVGVDDDPERVAVARKALNAAGLYGTRISVRVGSAETLPFTDCFANLIVSDAATVSRGIPGKAGELYRHLRPCGGTLVIGSPHIAVGGAAVATKRRLRSLLVPALPGEGRLVEEGGELWAVIRRGPLPGAGAWTHTYAEPGNSACSGDDRVKGPLALQWFGRPGPRRMIDRHHRNVPPLYRDGRLFVPGDDVVFVVDAYNGTPLWEVEIPGLRRLGVFLDTSNLVVDADHLHAAHGSLCERYRVADGSKAASFRVPGAAGGATLHWSYLARAGGLIFGSGRLPEGSYTETSHAADAALWYDNMAIVTSRTLFALDGRTGEIAWTREAGIVLNPTIAIDAGRVHFIESMSPAALRNELGRMPHPTFLAGDNFLVALDAETGEVLHRRKIDLTDCRLISYLNACDGILLLSGCRYVEKKLWYFFYGLDAATGKELWRQSHNSGFDPGGGHGEQNRHPTIVDGVAYTYPFAYGMKSGRKLDGYAFSRSGHGCGGVSASLHSLFWRGGNPTMRDLRPGGGVSRINHVSRPGCWINIIPAGGLVLIPEASSGCTCAFPLQTSFAYLPKEK